MAGFWDRLRGRDQPLERLAQTTDEVYQILENERDRRIRAEAKEARQRFALWVVGTLVVVGGILVAVWGVNSATRDSLDVKTDAHLNSLNGQVSQGHREGCATEEEWANFLAYVASARAAEPEDREEMARRDPVMEVVPGCGDYVTECRGDVTSDWIEGGLTAEPGSDEGDYLLLPLQEGILPICVVPGLDLYDPETWSSARGLVFLEDALNRD